MKQTISKNLQDFMFRAGINLTDLINLCAEIPAETIKKIYYGTTENPKIDTIYEICDALNISIDYLVGLKKYDNSELNLLTNFRKSSKHGKEFLLTMSEFEMQYTNFENEQEKTHEIDCMLPKGTYKKEKYVTCMEPTGKFKDGVLFDTGIFTKIPTHLDSAFMAIKIPNNYLLPTYAKDDIVFMEKRNPEFGETAVFQKDNYIFIRQFNYDAINRKFVLKSLNINSDDLVLDNLDNYTIKGTLMYIDRTSNDSLKAISKKIRLSKKKAAH